MSLILDGTNGLSDVDGSAATPAIRGSDANTGVFFPAADTIAFAEGGAEVARFNSSGNLGIGTSSPQQKLHVYDGASGGTRTAGVNTIIAESSVAVGLQLLSPNTTAQYIFFGDPESSQAGRIVYEHANNAMAFNTNATERMRIDSSGNLLVGTTSAITAGSEGVQIEPGNAIKLRLARNTTALASQAAFYNPNGAVGTIQTSGSSTSYNTSSDYRLKHDIQPMTGALAKVAQLKPVTYKWNADNSESQGFIAHELQEVVPECVTGEKDAVDAEGKPQYQGIDTSFLVATLTAAIKEQQAIITALTARVEALEGAQA
jgi:hypothetical protein